MTKQMINLGTPPKGSDGDTSRVAFEKTNDNFDELYARAQGKLTKNISGGAGVTALTDTEAINGFIDITGSLTGARTITVPPTIVQAYTVRNSTSGGFSITFKTSSGSGVDLTPGQTALVYSDGENIINPVAPPAHMFPGRLMGVRVITSSGTYTPTPGATMGIVEGVGAGGAAGGAAANASGSFSCGSGGGSGAYFKHFLSTLVATAVTIGSGGVGSAGAAGGAGGSTSFGSITAPGGYGGFPSGSGPASRASGGNGAPTATGANALNMGGSQGGASYIYGLGTYTPGAGASSPLGTGGNALNDANGNSGTGFGSGGGGMVTANNAAYAGGAGRPGVVIVWEYA